MIPAEEALFEWSMGGNTSLAGIYAERLAASTELFKGQDDSARSRRLAVYAKRHLDKVTRSLRGHFEATAAALGEAGFREAVRLYIAELPPTRPQLRWLGHLFAEFLSAAKTQRWLETTNQPWLGALAHLDWAQSLATDAPQEDPLQFAQLRQLPSEQWAQLHVTWLSCVQRVDTRHDLLNLRSAALSTAPASRVASNRQPQGTLAGVGLGSGANDNDPFAERHWVVTRRGFDILSLELSPLEARTFDALRHPLSLTELSELLAADCHLDETTAARQAVAWVQQWSECNCLKRALRTSLPPCR